MNIKIIYEDKAVLVCYKPAGFPVQTGKVGQTDCVSELKNRISRESGKAQPYLGVVHRLDQPAEGLLVFAKSKEAAAELTRQLQSREMYKKYYAAVYGAPAAPGGEWARAEHYLIQDKRSNTARAVSAGEPEARRAVLQYRVLERDEEGKISFLEVELETGRFHQIRAQMAALGHPLLGDRKYATQESAAISARLGVRNTALCACSLAFRNPETGGFQEFTCEPMNPAFALWDRK